MLQSDGPQLLRVLVSLSGLQGSRGEHGTGWNGPLPADLSLWMWMLCLDRPRRRDCQAKGNRCRNDVIGVVRLLQPLHLLLLFGGAREPSLESRQRKDWSREATNVSKLKRRQPARDSTDVDVGATIGLLEDHSFKHPQLTICFANAERKGVVHGSGVVKMLP